MSVGAAGHASGCWHSAVGAGVRYNREKNKSFQGTGFPSISGQNSGTFGAALRGALRGLGKWVPVNKELLTETVLVNNNL